MDRSLTRRYCQFVCPSRFVLAHESRLTYSWQIYNVGLRTMRNALLFALLAFTGCSLASAEPPKKEGDRKSTFVITLLRDGRYTPWRESKDEITYYAGEITTIQGTQFRYTYFTDAVIEGRIDPNYSGTLKVFDDHIYLDHPGVPYPYRITGMLDGVYVMVTWEGYQEWKKFGKIMPHHLLYLEKK